MTNKPPLHLNKPSRINNLRINDQYHQPNIKVSHIARYGRLHFCGLNKNKMKKKKKKSNKADNWKIGHKTNPVKYDGVREVWKTGFGIIKKANDNPDSQGLNQKPI